VTAAAAAADARQRCMLPGGLYQTWVLELGTKERNALAIKFGGDGKGQVGESEPALQAAQTEILKVGF